ncbi:NlpC/P60 family protein [Streptomyces sp. XD-27]|uniref:NlpC/P60 family protein n=1 Tax=Streptomyces sp. XD-27 TaxID=3062779 RepID=UPI0026F43A37|nr:NlpC/P60 family protein [Streptomyces sp. XD-27]WKX74435.1 NlpC/P60 family protein [Streptomyces sp. XD-27]
MRQIGKPYVWGAEGPDAFDCSGLTQQAWRQAGYLIPRTSQEQWRTLPRVPLSELRPGDLVVYYPKATHVALYAGGGAVVEAPRPGGRVRTSPLATYPLRGAVRPDAAPALPSAENPFPDDAASPLPDDAAKPLPDPEKPTLQRPDPEKPTPEKPALDQPTPDKPASDRPAPEKPVPAKPAPGKPAPERPAPAKTAPERLPDPDTPRPAPSDPPAASPLKLRTGGRR